MGLIKIVAAGILSLPALVVAVVTAPVIAVLSLPSLALLCFQASDAKSCSKSDNKDNSTKEQQEEEEQHAIISGGSSGIGLSIAQDCVKRGMLKVTIMARNVKKLEEACKQLEPLKTNPQTSIQYKSVDVSNFKSLEETAKEICVKSSTTTKTKYYLFCCAGQPFPSYFEHVPTSTFEQLVHVNQLGTMFTVKAFLPHFQKATMVFTSSMAGQVGVYGFTAYSPTKFALRGFAEALHSELSDNPDINVQVAFPPDTDTPGFQEEEKMKPYETRMISEQAGLANADDVAHSMVEAATVPNPTFFVYFNFEGWMLSALTCGMSPVSSLADAITQVALNGIFRYVSLFYLNYWWTVIRNCAYERYQNKQEKQRPADTTRAGGKSTTESSTVHDEKKDA